MTNSQQKIDTERDAMGILRHIVVHDWRNRGGEWVRVDGGIAWTLKVFSEMLGDAWSTRRIQDALDWLKVREYVIFAGDYRGTVDGCEAYSNAAARGEFATGAAYQEFKEEALTGLTPTGARSQLTRAALPGPECGVSHTGGDYVVMDAVLKKLSKDLHITVDEVKHRLRDGSIRECKGLDGVAHVGIFEPGADGKTKWRHICRECRKALERRRYRQKARRK